ncbi:HAMP domain-containing histidine kinase [bacterium]|nr:HAMP domain-containing histidine kinase [bacterium]QQR56816.1 MAG: HAMP domain-containing histidine kinase [Candidatus Melainabacteria bacterium]
MRESILSKMKKSWKHLVCRKADNQNIETLTSYIMDTEHEELSVITALKAHLDLMQDELARNSQPLSRFVILNRSIIRLISDIESLTSVSQQAIAEPQKQKLVLEDLLKEIEISTQPEFSEKEVSLSWNIKKGTVLIGNAIQMKHMLTEIIYNILHGCKKLDNINITGQEKKRCVSMTFSANPIPTVTDYIPWRLGELRLIPSNGDGIGLATIAAMAKLQHGQLSITGFKTEKQVFKLVFCS